MYLNVYASHSLEGLAAAFCEKMQQERLPVFQPYHIVTQTEGINQWLRYRVADSRHIAANLRFVRANDIIYRMYQLLDGPQFDSLSTEDLNWLLYEILGRPAFREQYPAIAAYFNGDEEQEPVRRYALAAKVADLFDQYQVYRDDILKEWISAPAVSAGNWQQYLWRCVHERVQDRADKTRQGEYIIEAVRDPERRARLQRHMPQIAVFGLSVLTKYHLRIFAAVAPHISLSFYLLNAAPEQYWMDALTAKQVACLVERGIWAEGDIAPGNPLLTGWGKLTAETFQLLFEEDAFINNYHLLPAEAPVPDSLLHKLQSDVYHNHHAGERHPISTGDLRDGSLEVHSCYTRAREVEALYNYLVHQVEHAGDKRISPREILVLVTDMDAYAPYIKAVFGNAPYEFPFTITGEQLHTQDNLVSALHLLLTLEEEHFDAERVVQLLDSSFIRRRFGITDTDLVRRAVNGANIRFGIDGNEADDTVYVSWKYGLRRLIYGICMTGGAAYNDGTCDCYPLELTEGSAAADLIRFCHFAERAIEVVHLRKEPRRLVDWALYVHSLLDLLQDAAAPLPDEYGMIEKQLEGLNLLNGWHGEPIPYAVFRRSFLDSLTDAAAVKAPSGKGISFSSLIPMRSIPARIVAVLGLNFDKFPRKEPLLSFNIMQEHVRIGDRNKKDNDKHLFLETLMAAREKLFLSYIGQSVKDNTPLPPSALVDELLDYIATGCPAGVHVHDELVRVHPLHSFSKLYRVPPPGAAPPRFYSYTQSSGKSTAEFLDPDPQRDPLDLEVVDLKDLIRFFRNPIAHYYSRVLQVRYDEASELLDSTELFELDRLQEWAIKQDLLLAADRDLPELRDRMLKTGKLPLKNMAPVVFGELLAAATPVRKSFQDLTRDRSRKEQSVEIRLEGGVLCGTIANLFDDTLVCYSLSRHEQKYLQDAWLQYLAAVAGGVAAEGVFISRAHEGACFRMELPGAAEATATLARLVDLYRKGHAAPAPFSPELGIGPDDLDALDAAGVREAIGKKIEGFNASFSDPYILREYYDGLFDDAGCQRFLDYCTELMAPLPAVFPGYYQTQQATADAE
ncbi:MAG: exodeoxyribonuclease V subunit gamma [Chitinophagaceae bacterium]|nr:MAG: exodeoxyribonuclease V subunit gamma [Chitinophagaceae bacterium]